MTEVLRLEDPAFAEFTNWTTNTLTRKAGLWEDVGTVTRASVIAAWLEAGGDSQELPIPAYSASEFWDAEHDHPLEPTILGQVQQVFWLVRHGILYLVDTQGYDYCRYISRVV